jgi:hypothetical protein
VESETKKPALIAQGGLMCRIFSSTHAAARRTNCSTISAGRSIVRQDFGRPRFSAFSKGVLIRSISKSTILARNFGDNSNSGSSKRGGTIRLGLTVRLGMLREYQPRPAINDPNLGPARAAHGSLD